MTGERHAGGDGRSGWSLHRFEPDVAVVNIGSAEIDYRDRAHTACARTARPSSAQTAYGKTENAERALEAGFHHHVVKPLDADRRLARFDEWHGAA